MKPLHLALLGFAFLITAQLLASFVVHPARPEAARHDEGMYFAELPPGEIAGTMMLGGFRGMAIDFLWLRAIQAKDAARYYESVALFDLISRVQPRFERVWEFMAWDMAYNIGHYVDQRDDKWSWYLAGLRANLRGVERNPDSERLLRHLAWMFFHKGENYMQRIEAVQWQPLIEAAARPYQEAYPMPTGTTLSSFELAAYFYELSVYVGETQKDRQPAFVRRMVPLAIDRDGNRLRNRGLHYQAMHRYIDALEAWQVIRRWVENPTGHHRPGVDNVLSDESFVRNEGLLRRKMINLSGRLALENKTADDFKIAVQQRNIQRCRELIDETALWRKHIQRSSVQWLDEEQLPDSSEQVNE